jgi:hypothetical protein
VQASWIAGKPDSAQVVLAGTQILSNVLKKKPALEITIVKAVKKLFRLK